MVSRDYEDLFRILNGHEVRYLLVGAHAVAFYAEPRFTKDLDVWIPPELNIDRAVYAAVKEFGAPMTGVSPGDFGDPTVIFQIGVAPVRVDIIMDLAGLPAAAAWRRRKRLSGAARRRGR